MLTYYIFPTVWREILAGHDAGLIAREMVERGMIKVNADRKPQTTRKTPDAPDGRKVYVVQITDHGEGSAADEPVTKLPF